MITDTFNLRELELSKSYGFDVIVKDGAAHFAGRLELTPKQSTIRIMGEERAGRECSIMRMRNPKRIVCSDLNKTFILSSINLLFSRSSSLREYPERAGFFECKFEFEFLLFIPSDYISNSTGVLSISIQSEHLNNWIGNTQKQEKIIKEYERTGHFPKDESLSDEFIHDTKTGRAVGISYPMRSFHSSPEFKTGLSFNPTFVLAFQGLLPLDSIRTEYERLFLLLSFVTGAEFRPKSVQFHYSSGLGGNGSVYFSSEPSAQSAHRDVILFPLGRSLRFDQLNLPEFPLSVFSAFYALAEKDIDLFRRYAKFRRLNNSEERYLGYFRLLERLTHKKKSHVDEERLSTLINRSERFLIRWFDDKKGVKSFCRGLLRYNNSKYHAEKCLADFFKSTPPLFRENIVLGRSDITEMCGLRNNLSHANDFVLDEQTLILYEHFTHAMLVLALFSKLEVDLETSSSIINRLRGFDFIRRREA